MSDRNLFAPDWPPVPRSRRTYRREPISERGTNDDGLHWNRAFIPEEKRPHLDSPSPLYANPWRIAANTFIVLLACTSLIAFGYVLVSGLLDGLPGPHDVLRVGGRP